MSVGKVIKNSGIYTIVSILQKCISFFLLPLYTAFLTPSDYGVLNIVTSISSLLSIFFLLGLNAAVSRFYFYHPNEENYVKKLWGAVAVCVLISSIVFGGLFIILHRFLIDPLIGDISFFPYMLIGICYTVVSPLYILFQTCLQTQQKSIYYGINTLSNFVINTVLIILFVAVWGKGVIGVLYANLITAVIFFLYVCIAYIPKLSLNLKKKYIVPAYKYSLPLVPHLLAGWSTGMIDRLLINGLRGESDTGLYSVGNQFGGIMATLTNAANMAFSPWLFESNKEKKFDEIRFVGSFTVTCFALIAFVISLFCPEVLQFMVSEEFRGVWRIIPVLSFAMVLNGMYFLFVDVLFINKTKLVFVVSIIALLFNVVLNIVLIPKYGILGSACACFISYLIKSLVSLLLYKKNNSEIRFNWLFMYLFTFSLFLLTFLNFPLASTSIGVSLLCKMILSISMCGVLYLIFRKHISMHWLQIRLYLRKNK